MNKSFTVKSKTYLLLLQLCFILPVLRAQDSNIVLKVPGAELHGSLRLAPGPKKGPVLLIISGSGPTDRDCNQKDMKSNAFLYLADSLAARGISSLRYDKRGIGSSTAIPVSERKMAIDTFAADALVWINLLLQDNRFSSVYVMGHSEGSLLGMLACQHAKKVAGMISVSGPGYPVDQKLREQLDYLPESNKKEVFDMIAQLKKGDTLSSVPPMYYMLFRPSVQPFLISFLKYDPAKEAARLKIPLLVIQGTNDIQVNEKDAMALAKAGRKSTLVLVRGMNHVLKSCPDCSRQKNIATYSDPSRPVMTELVEAITAFCIHGKGK